MLHANVRRSVRYVFEVKRFGGNTVRCPRMGYEKNRQPPKKGENTNQYDQKITISTNRPRHMTNDRITHRKRKN